MTFVRCQCALTASLVRCACRDQLAAAVVTGITLTTAATAAAAAAASTLLGWPTRLKRSRHDDSSRSHPTGPTFTAHRTPPSHPTGPHLHSPSDPTTPPSHSSHCLYAGSGHGGAEVYETLGLGPEGYEEWRATLGTRLQRAEPSGCALHYSYSAPSGRCRTQSLCPVPSHPHPCSPPSAALKDRLRVRGSLAPRRSAPHPPWGPILTPRGIFSDDVAAPIRPLIEATRPLLHAYLLPWLVRPALRLNSAAIHRTAALLQGTLRVSFAADANDGLVDLPSHLGPRRRSNLTTPPPSTLPPPSCPRAHHPCPRSSSGRHRCRPISQAPLNSTRPRTRPHQPARPPRLRFRRCVQLFCTTLTYPSPWPSRSLPPIHQVICCTLTPAATSPLHPPSAWRANRYATGPPPMYVTCPKPSSLVQTIRRHTRHTRRIICFTPESPTAATPHLPLATCHLWHAQLAHHPAEAAAARAVVHQTSAAPLSRRSCAPTRPSCQTRQVMPSGVGRRTQTARRRWAARRCRSLRRACGTSCASRGRTTRWARGSPTSPTPCNPHPSVGPPMGPLPSMGPLHGTPPLHGAPSMGPDPSMGRPRPHRRLVPSCPLRSHPQGKVQAASPLDQPPPPLYGRYKQLFALLDAHDQQRIDIPDQLRMRRAAGSVAVPPHRKARV
jgi:hypothetical protein